MTSVHGTMRRVRAQPQQFVEQDLRGARFVESDLSGVVMRGVLVSGMDIDAPWLPHGDGLVVNGVDVAGFVEAELDRRFPGRDRRRAADPAGVLAAWEAVTAAWDSMREQVATLPADVVDASVDGEWSFSQTLRHLVFAIDLWLGEAVLQRAQPFHPLGLRHAVSEQADPATGTEAPSYADVVTAWRQRAATVHAFLADVTDAVLVEQRPHPHEPGSSETVLSCLRVILEESWEHLRFAARDVQKLTGRLPT